MLKIRFFGIMNSWKEGVEVLRMKLLDLTFLGGKPGDVIISARSNNSHQY